MKESWCGRRAPRKRGYFLRYRRHQAIDRYLDATGEAQAVGTRLAVVPRDFEDALSSVGAVGAALVQSLIA